MPSIRYPAWGTFSISILPLAPTKRISMSLSIFFNAKQLVEKNAALMIPDADAAAKLVDMVIDLAADDQRRNRMIENVGALAITDADRRVAEEILKSI